MASTGCLGSEESPPIDYVAHGTELLATATCDTPGEWTCPGAALPELSLTDIQPLSPDYEREVTLSAYQGEVTLIVFLAAW